MTKAIEIIKSELINDPNVIGYSTMTDEECFNSLINKNINAKQSIPARDIREYLALKNKLLQIENSVSQSAIAATRYLELFDSFSLAKPEVETALIAILDGLIADTLIDATDKTSILAMGDKQISRAEQLGISVKLGWVEQARAI